MIILKLTIMCGIIGICSYLGILKSKTFEIRLSELKKIQSSLNIFKTKIDFTYEPIKEIFEEISKIVYNNENNIFKNTAENLKNKNITDAWCIGITMTSNYFEKEDKEVLKTLGNLLGKTDKSGQISEINMTMNLLDTQIEKAEIEKNKNVKLYRALGMIVGVGIIIILM